jgi:hypothetical protein
MPFKHESSTLKEEGIKTEFQGDEIQGLATSVKDLNIMNVSIEGKNTKISIDYNGLRWFRSVDAIMTTRLEDKQTELFLQNLPDFLKNKTSERGNLDFVVSRPLGDDGRERISYCIGFTPGYAEPNKRVIRNHTRGNFVAEAYYPERRLLNNRAYSGKELTVDGLTWKWMMISLQNT